MKLRGFFLFFASFGWLALKALQAHHFQQEIEYWQKAFPAYADMMLEGRPPLYDSLLTLAAIPGLGIGSVIFFFDLKEWWRKRRDAGIGQAN